uniref:Glycosyltransferase 25 family member n=1 Tax=Echinostoma caproni TaxID=27848 RepID=A0A183AMZ8_9TREM
LMLFPTTMPDTVELPAHFTAGNLRPSYELPPTVYIGVPVRNKAHSLPYFLHGLEIQDYPTERMHLSFIHHLHFVQIRQKLLDAARLSWADFYLSIDADVMLQGYYKRSPDYFEIQKRHKTGVFPVAMVHTMFVINLHHFLTPLMRFYPPADGYVGPIDDLILLAKSAQAAGVQYYLDNTQFYGYISAPVEESEVEEIGSSMEHWIARDQELFTHLRLQAAHLPTRSKLGLDEIYYINLLRRPDRRMKTEYFLDQLGVAAQHVIAVDGKDLNMKKIEDMGIAQLKGYADPYHKRSLKFGEIGCFMSHYYLWKVSVCEMIERGYRRILILEDDVRFAPGFVRNLADVIREADLHKPEWDLLYIGRKRMSKNETRVPGTTKLAYPDYTYWTLGYLLKQSGAEKLLAQNPLKKMVAVDEFLPIMFNRHPQKAWLEAFEPRNLIALSAEPLLLEPQKYTGEKSYVSDTEDSGITIKSAWCL